MDTTFDDVIEQIVQSVFATMLDTDVTRTAEEVCPGSESLLATIQFSGAWTGGIVLELSPQVAVAAAGRMLRMPVADVTDVDQHEVAAELANMIGGNLKSMLPGPTYLSLPMIVSGREIGLQVHDAALMERVPFASPDGPIQVRLYEHVIPSET